MGIEDPATRPPPGPGITMRKLNWNLAQLQKGRRDGSHGTRRDRKFALAQIANTLHESGYRGLRARGLKGKHIEALVRDWTRLGVAHGTMANRMAFVCWWADEVGKPNIVKSNAEYGIAKDKGRVSDGTKRRDLVERLALAKDDHGRMALRLQAAFGLRREEAIKFAPSYADRGDHVAVKASTASSWSTASKVASTWARCSLRLTVRTEGKARRGPQSSRLKSARAGARRTTGTRSTSPPGAAGWCRTRWWRTAIRRAPLARPLRNGGLSGGTGAGKRPRRARWAGVHPGSAISCRPGGG